MNFNSFSTTCREKTEINQRILKRITQTCSLVSGNQEIVGWVCVCRRSELLIESEESSLSIVVITRWLNKNKIFDVTIFHLRIPLGWGFWFCDDDESSGDWQRACKDKDRCWRFNLGTNHSIPIFTLLSLFSVTVVNERARRRVGEDF